MASLHGDVVAKKKTPSSESPASDAPKTTTKVAVDLMRKARHISLFQSIELFDYIDAIIRPVIEADYRDAIKREMEGRK